MSSPNPISYPPAQLPGPPESDHPPRGNTLSEMFSWTVIVAIVAMLFVDNFVAQNEPLKDAHTRTPGEFAEVQEVGFQTRLQIGIRNQLGKASEIPSNQVPLEGSLWRRYASLILIAETLGSEQALKRIPEIDQAIRKENFQPDEKQTKVRIAIEEVLNERAGNGDKIPPGGFSEGSAKVLSAELGWLGTVLLNPGGSQSPTPERSGIDDRSNRLFVFVGIGALIAIMATICSIVAFAVSAWMLWRGHFHPQMLDDSASGPVYIEVFALWFISYLLFPGLLAGLFPQLQWIGLAGIIMTFWVLMWPMIRGIPPGKMLRDMGFVVQNPFTEFLCGVFGYLCTLSLLAFSLVLTIPFVRLVQMYKVESLASQPPLHPIQDVLTPGNYLTPLLMACVMAPLIEETMFRGALFRYLRDRTSHQKRWASVLVSILVSGLVFALIHPQNLVSLIPLTTVATGMALLRLWRSSLMAPMVMHAIHNFVLVSLMIVTRI